MTQSIQEREKFNLGIGIHGESYEQKIDRLNNEDYRIFHGGGRLRPSGDAWDIMCAIQSISKIERVRDLEDNEVQTINGLFLLLRDLFGNEDKWGQCVLDDDTDQYSSKKTVYSLSIPNFKDSKCGCDLECNCTTIDTPLARFPQHRKEMKACKFKSNRKALKHFQELGIYDDDEAGFGRGFAKEESK